MNPSARPTEWDFLPAYAAVTAGGTPVVLRRSSGMDYTTAELESATPAAGGEPAELVVSGVRGLTGNGHVGVDAYSEWLNQTAHPTPELRDFLDLFHHTVLRLYPEAAGAVGYPPAAEPDRLAALLAGLLGLAAAPAPPHDPRLFHFSEYCRPTRPLAALGDILSGHFGGPATAAMAPGRYVSLTEAEAAVAGRPAVFDAGTVRVTLGPAGWGWLRRFVPKVGPAFAPLARLAAEYLGPQRAFEVELALAPGDPGPAADDPAGGRMGWTSWLAADGDRRGLISTEECRAGAKS